MKEIGPFCPAHCQVAYVSIHVWISPQKHKRIGGWEPSFASNYRLNFRALIRPYWDGQVHRHIKDARGGIISDLENLSVGSVL